MDRLPLLLSIPHGGLERPAELSQHLCITDRDLFDDSDPFVVEIYGLEKAERVIKTDIARAFVDLNRSIRDMPPANPDGLIKSMTCYQKPIYIRGKEPDQTLRNLLIESYYNPYHDSIKRAVRELDLKICLDCHSMASVAPDISPDKNDSRRPKFCISNQNGKTSSQEMMDSLADSISENFTVPRREISQNSPFRGGHITRTYGNNPVPWIQVEMNRDMYLSGPWFDGDSLSVDPSRLEDLNRMFEQTVESFMQKL